VTVAPAGGLAVAPARTVPEAAGLPQNPAQACYGGFPTGSRQNDYPVNIVIDAMLANMFAWIEQGAPPPRAPLIAVDARGETGLDSDGNAIGGLRLPQVSVPIATYGVGSGSCRNFGYTLPLPTVRKRQLHESREAYVAKVREAAGKLRRQGHILAGGESELLARAEAAEPF
jgi:hypothetical protein